MADTLFKFAFVVADGDRRYGMHRPSDDRSEENLNQRGGADTL